MLTDNWYDISIGGIMEVHWRLFFLSVTGTRKIQTLQVVYKIFHCTLYFREIVEDVVVGEV